MHCPACENKLRAVTTKQGVIVDHCDSCKGIWLDQGEIYFFTKKPKVFYEALQKGLQNPQPTERKCPRCSTKMEEGNFLSATLRLDQCPSCHGIWFDDGELRAALELGERQFSLDLEQDESGAWGAEPLKGKAAQPHDAVATQEQKQRHSALAAGLASLPSLTLRSTLSFVILYGFLGFILLMAQPYLGWGIHTTVLIYVVAIFIQYMIGPWLLDLSLRFFYNCNWVELKDLPDHLSAFIRRVCKEKGMKIPSFAIIEDSAPNAFTYGHTPKNARVVITRGILEYLEPAEAEAVVAHELGHAYHWDILVMTLASLVPVLLYYVYRTLIRQTQRRSRGSKDKGEGYAIIIAVTAYILYIISEYIVLWLSRVREYWADRFSGEVTGKPNVLASALVKIAYGLVAPKKGQTTTSENSETDDTSRNLDAIKALGIFDRKAAQSLALQAYSHHQAHGSEAKVETAEQKERIAGAMQWDLWNPWATYYELHSTHPLPAKRINSLTDQAASMNQEPFILFNRRKPESYWDEFLVDVFVYWLTALPLIGVLAYLGLASYYGYSITEKQGWCIGGIFLISWGILYLLQTFFSYRGPVFPKMQISSLLSKVKVSAIRSVPVTLTGTIIGKGVPGYMFSEDMVLEDESGIIFLDYRQPMSIFEFFFALMRTNKFIGKKVTVEGWYRRSPTPYLEIKRLILGVDSSQCYVYHFKLVWAFLLMAFGFACLFASVGM